MPIGVTELAIPDIKIIRPAKFEDPRGFFSESYNAKAFAEAGIDLNFVQDNHSGSVAAGTVRGLHFQIPPYAQDKLIRVIKGRILDVAVDLRRSSATFGKWVATELRAADLTQMFIPVGFAHAYCTLEPNTEVLYKVSNYYSAAHEFGVRWNDPDVGIRWPVEEAAAILSDKDKRLPLLRDAQHLFD